MIVCWEACFDVAFAYAGDCIAMVLGYMYGSLQKVASVLGPCRRGFA